MDRKNMTVAMTLTRTAACTLAVAIASASAAGAQDPPGRPLDRSQLRHQIYVMEGALSRAVEFGAQSLNREIRTFMPEAFVLAGQARARGVYLDGYGIFFDVEVPIMRQSMMWSLRTMLDQDSAGLQKALTDIRAVANKTANPAERQLVESAISRLELQLGPMSGVAGPANNPFAAAIQNAQPQPSAGLGQSVSSQTMLQNAPPVEDAPSQEMAPRALPIDKLWMKDPNRAYTESVQRALVDAMIDYSAPMTITAEEWLTVAARDNYQRDSLAPANPLEEVDTILLRIQGADLMAYRSGNIDREEARKRVTLSAF